MNSPRKLDFKNIISKSAGGLIILCFIIICLISFTGGFIFNLFGINITFYNYKNPLLIISVFWILKKLLSKSKKQQFLKLFKMIGIIFSTFIGLIIINYLLLEIRAGDQKKYFNTNPGKTNKNLPINGLSDDWNLILISIDTLRPDHLGGYGYKRNTSPNIDKLAEYGVLFDDHIAAGPSTLISHASIITSLYPSTHRAECSTKTPLSENALTMAEVLSDNDFTTAAFTGSGQMNHIYGLNQGFKVYNDKGGKIHKILKRSIDWVNINQNKRFFLFIHSYETHHPYTPPKPFDNLFYSEYRGKIEGKVTVKMLEEINSGALKINEDDREKIIALYDGEVSYVDHQLNGFFNKLKSMSIWDKTLIIFTSDHGEEFNEHGIMGWHSHTLYDELLKTPLIIKFPNNLFKGRVIKQQTRGIDIFPTVLKIFNIKTFDVLQGISLTELIADPELEITLSALSERETDGQPFKIQKSLRYKNYKYMITTPIREPASKIEKYFANLHLFNKDIDSSNRELYHIKKDKGETLNLYRSLKGISQKYEKRIWELTKSNQELSSGFQTVKAKIDQKLKKKLKSLGYLD